MYTVLIVLIISKDSVRRSGWNQGMPRCDLKSVTSRRFRPIICIVEAKNVQMMSSQCWATIGNHVLHILIFWKLVVDWLIMCHSISDTFVFFPLLMWWSWFSVAFTKRQPWKCPRKVNVKCFQWEAGKDVAFFVFKQEAWGERSILITSWHDSRFCVM